ncbi:MAG: hypothetical protein SYR96_25945 [Actinomycetota bacterium]|nr:hypothetical protein [Actinomycetota bacterium]
MRTDRQRRHRPAAAVLLLSLALAPAGCGSEPSDSSAPAPQATSAAGGRPPSPEAVNSCELLSDAEMTAVIGHHGGGSPGPDGCVWENPESAHSVTLSVGLPGTAGDGDLPASDPILGEPEPGPDGIRFVAGEAEFAAGNRVCRLRVVTSVTDDTDRSTMVELARLVRERIPSDTDGDGIGG